MSPLPGIQTSGFILALTDVEGDLYTYMNRAKETKARDCISKWY